MDMVWRALFGSLFVATIALAFGCERLWLRR